MGALQVLVLDVDSAANRPPAGIAAAEAAADVLRQTFPGTPVEVVTRANRLRDLLEAPSDLVLVHDPSIPMSGPDPALRALAAWESDEECVAAVICLRSNGSATEDDLAGPLVVTGAALGASHAVSQAANLADLVATLDRTVGVSRVTR